MQLVVVIQLQLHMLMVIMRLQLVQVQIQTQLRQPLLVRILLHQINGLLLWVVVPRRRQGVQQPLVVGHRPQANLRLLLAVVTALGEIKIQN
ncbi:hypothetical protein HMPREF2726_10590 [Neisseria sp. HMSC074B07]|nr:hypothetical protein HMPREF2726_10590 [Neisseria sp. HMSC074B07]